MRLIDLILVSDNYTVLTTVLTTLMFQLVVKMD